MLFLITLYLKKLHNNNNLGRVFQEEFTHQNTQVRMEITREDKFNWVENI